MVGGHLLLREDGGLTIAKGLKSEVVEPTREDPPLLPALVVEDEDDGPPTPTRRVRKKTTLKTLRVDTEEKDGWKVFEEMGVAEVADAYMNTWREEGVRKTIAEAQSVPVSVKKAEVTYTPNIEEVLEYHLKNKKPLEVTHTVSLDDVKANLEKWAPSAEKEFTNLRSVKRAFDVVSRQDLPPGCKIVPGKAVFTVKPDKDSFRRKTRIVACGNYAGGESDHQSLYAAGLDASSLRTILALSSGRSDWRVALTDIRQAFVLAPWTGPPVAVQPPSIAVKLGLVGFGDLLLVRQSLYGLRESPAIWAAYRDAELKMAKFSFCVDGKEIPCHLKPMISDTQVWQIVQEENDEIVYGYLLVYVDDVLMVGAKHAADAIYEWIAKKWECDELATNPLRFLGMELFLSENGFELGQRGFVQELLRSHGHGGRRSRSQGSRDAMMLTVEEEEALIAAKPAQREEGDPVLRLAQRRVGELLWLASRTRPDLMYLVALLSSKVTMAPETVNVLGERVLDYLKETQHYRLTFPAFKDPQDVHVYTDSSFAPSSGRSHGSAAVFYNGSPIIWRSSRQQLVTLSTAESELIEAVEGTMLAMSTLELMQELTGTNPTIVVHVDNQAALSLANGTMGSWRTRHLRLRMCWLRERVAAGEVRVVFEPGVSQRADLGTKPLTRDRLGQLVDLWGIHDAPPKIMALTPTTTSTLERNGAFVGTRPTTSSTTTWSSVLLRLAGLCQVCGAQPQPGDEQGMEPTFPWEFYMLMVIVAIATVAIWEFGRRSCTTRLARLQVLRDQAHGGDHNVPLSRGELEEMQCLLDIDPGALDLDQAGRLLHLRGRFGARPNPCRARPAPVQRAAPIVSASAASSSTQLPAPLPQSLGVDVATQTTQPSFEYLEPQPVPIIQLRK